MGELNKESWPPGPWHSEPDELEWQHCGLQCCMRRNWSGAWCGYVRVPEGHPHFGVHYDELYQYDVHCELTFSGSRRDQDGWWVGFDCSQKCDGTPACPHRGVYRDLQYAKEQTESLAEQVRSRSKS